LIYIYYIIVNIILYLIYRDNLQIYPVYIFSGLLIFFNIILLRKEYIGKKDFFFISPIFLATLVNFGLVLGGLTNFILASFGENYFLRYSQLTYPANYKWMHKTMFVVNLACCVSWLAYHSNIGAMIYRKIMGIGYLKTIFKADFSYKRIVILAIIAYSVKFYLYSIGLFGRIVSTEYFETGVGYKAGSQIRILGDLSYLTLFVISYFKASLPKSAKLNLLFFGSIALELFFGFVSGARSPFIVPFLIVVVAYYLVNQRIKWYYPVLILLSVYIAFTLVLDFKNYSLSKSFKWEEGQSAITTYQNFSKYNSRFAVEKDDDNLRGVLSRTTRSICFIPETALSIYYVDEGNVDKDKHPNIIGTIAVAPVDAFIPKSMLGKTEFTWGYWFKNEFIMNTPELKYSEAMSPVGFLYLGGGVILVIVGFFIYGIMVRITSCFLYHKKNLIHLMTYFILLSNIYNLDSVFSNAFIIFLRYIFIFPIFFWFIFSTKLPVTKK
jgi:hypothetical protein